MFDPKEVEEKVVVPVYANEYSKIPKEERIKLVSKENIIKEERTKIEYKGGQQVIQKLLELGEFLEEPPRP